MDYIYILIGIFAFFNIIITKNFWEKWDKSSLINVNAVIGILGTFLGITIALLNFDLKEYETIRNINQDTLLQKKETFSIMDDDRFTKQLEGMIDSFKLAFITSIFGLLVGLFVRFFKKDKVEDNEEKQVQQSFEKMDNLISIQKEMKTVFQGVITELSEKNILALERVVENFNNKFQTQFGENFLQFGEALKSFVPFVQKFSEGANTLTDKVNSIADLQKGVSEVQRAISDNVAEISKTVQRMNESTAETLQKHQNAIQQWSTVLGQIQSNYQSISVEVTNIVKTMSQNYNDSIDNLQEAIEQMDINLTATTQLIKNLNSVTVDGYNLLKESMDKVRETNHLLVNSLQENINQQSQNLNQFIHHTINESHQYIYDTVVQAQAAFLNKMQELQNQNIQHLDAISQTHQHYLNAIYEQINMTANHLGGIRQDYNRVLQSAFEIINAASNQSQMTNELNQRLAESILNVEKLLHQNNTIANSLEQLSDVIKNFTELVYPLLQAIYPEGKNTVQKIYSKLDELTELVQSIKRSRRRTILERLLGY